MAASAGEHAWPEKVVAFKDLQPLSQFQLRVPHLVSKGKVEGPSVVKTHVDAQGAVQRVVLLESCGNGEIDEAAIRAMRDMRFQPYAPAGVPIAVTLVLPIHVPKRLGRKE